MIEDKEWLSLMTRQPPAPDAVIHLWSSGVDGSSKRCETNHCQCRKAGLNCTDPCSWSDNGDICENEEQIALVEETDNGDESDGDDDDNDTF